MGAIDAAAKNRPTAMAKKKKSFLNFGFGRQEAAKRVQIFAQMHQNTFVGLAAPVLAGEVNVLLHTP